VDQVPSARFPSVLAPVETEMLLGGSSGHLRWWGLGQHAAARLTRPLGNDLRDVGSRVCCITCIPDSASYHVCFPRRLQPFETTRTTIVLMPEQACKQGLCVSTGAVIRQSNARLNCDPWCRIGHMSKVKAHMMYLRLRPLCTRRSLCKAGAMPPFPRIHVSRRR
jgi:hypothetical protein